MTDPSGVLRPGAGPADAVELLLPVGTTEYDIADTVETVFAAHPGIDGVAVYLGARLGGHVLRADLDAAAAPDSVNTKSYGDGDGATLPGIAPLAPLSAVCPRCATEYLVASFDPAEPSPCRLDGTALELR
ncbi:hypothetical protein [Nocardia sp. NPDC057353]|uniref:hypothetical protein n=1 Tax=Nocardia sp. NPDC057353 TaxID=3346104 RepID=UPI00363EDCFE